MLHHGQMHTLKESFRRYILILLSHTGLQLHDWFIVFVKVKRRW